MMISGYAEYSDMVNKANQSEGTTLANQEKYAESLKGKLQELKTVWEDIGFNVTFDNKSILGWILDGGTGISKVIKDFGLLQSAITAFVTVSSLRGKGPITNVGPIDGTNKYGIYKGGLFNLKDMFQKKSILSVSDLDALNLYNTKVRNGADATIAFNEAMAGASSTAQGYARAAMNSAASTGSAVVAMEQIPKVSRAARIGLTTLSTLFNVGLTIAISVGISKIIELATAFEEMSKKAAEATSKFKEESGSIEDYKTKITDLRKSLSDQNITYEDARSKREELLNIQKELIDSYGAEAQGIDLVNGSLDKQIEKLDTINSSKRQEWLNKVNKQEWYDYVLHPDRTNAEVIKDTVEKFTAFAQIDKNAMSYGNLLDQLNSYDGVTISKTGMVKISGGVKTVRETIKRIQTELVGSRDDLSQFNDYLTQEYNKATEIYDKNWDTYQTYLETQILDDKTGLDYYGKLTEAYKKYQDAKTSGNERSIQVATNEYSSLLKEISNLSSAEMSDTFKKYFEDMYPDMLDIVSKWKFDINITPKINTNKDNIQSDINVLKDFSTEQILAAFKSGGVGVSPDQMATIVDFNRFNKLNQFGQSNNGLKQLDDYINDKILSDYKFGHAGVTPDQMSAIINLNKLASENGMTFEGFLEQLRKQKYLMNQADKDTADYINNFTDNPEDREILQNFFEKNNVSPDKFKEIVGGITDVTEAINKYNAAMDEANKPRFGETVKSISTLEEQLSSLDAAYADLIDTTDETPGKISFESLKKINDAFGGLELEGYEDFMKTISKSGVTAKEVKDALDKLTSEYLDQSDALKNLTDDNKDLVISMLKEKGIANAEQIVMDKLSIKTAEATLEKGILADTSDKTEKEILDEVDAFIKEGNYSEYAATMIRRFALQKQFAEGVKLRNQDDINYLIEIAKQAGISIKILNDLQRVKAYMSLSDKGKAQLSEEYRSQIESTMNAIQNGTYTLDFNAVNIPTNFTGGTDTKKAAKSNADSAKKVKDAQKDYNKSMQEAQKSLDKLNKEEIAENTKYSIDLVNLALERIEKTISSIEEAVDGLFEKDYLGKITLTKDAMANAVSYGVDLRAEFERLSAIEPQSAQEAQDLASAMEGLGDKIRQNYRDLIEYRSQLVKLRVDGLVSLGEDGLKINEQLSSMMDKNFKIFTGEEAGEISFDLLPTIPKSAVQKQRAENDALIKEEQRYQDEITEIKRTALAMQKAENEQARAEERARIAEDMAEAKAKLEEAVAEAKGVQDIGVENSQNSMNATGDAQKEFDSTVQQEQASANAQITSNLQGTLSSTSSMLQGDISAKLGMISSFVGNVKSQIAELASYVSSVSITMPSITTGDVSIGGDGTTIGSESTDGASITADGGGGSNYADLAKSYIGKVKYVYGGSSLETGTDCSGFTQAIYGLKARDTAGQMASSEGTKVSLPDLQPGDQVFLLSPGSPSGRHTGIYVGDGKMISNRGKAYGVQLHNFDAGKFLMAKRYYTGTNGNTRGIALVGDDKEGKLNKIRPELIVGRDGVRLVGVNGAEFVNLEEGERVLPYEVTRQVLANSNINFPRYAGGKTVTIPNKYGTAYTYMGWQTVKNKDSKQYSLREKAGMKFDSEGYAVINGRKVVAVTSKMGSVGDYIDIKLADGSVIPAVVGDIKNTNDKGANEWGHNGGQVVVEFVVDKGSWYGKKENPHLARTVSITNLGQNYFNNPTGSNLSKASASGGTTTVSLDDETEQETFKNWDEIIRINSQAAKNSEETNSILKGLGVSVPMPLTEEYLKEGGEGEKATEARVSRSLEYMKWLNDLLNGIGVQPEIAPEKLNVTELLDAIRGKKIDLKDLIDNKAFVPMKLYDQQGSMKELYELDTDEVIKYISDSLEYIQFENYKAQSETLQMQYEDVSKRYQLMLSDYQTAVEAGATATDLQIMLDSLEELKEEKDNVFKNLTSTIETVYNIFENRLEREVSVIEDRLRIQEELNDKLERQAGLTDDVVRQYDILSEQIKINSEKATIYEDQKNTAHRLRMEYQQLIETDPAFKWLTDRVDLESLFNTDGKINSLGQYYISAINQTEEFAGQGARLANILETIESAKTMWAEASTAQEEVMWDSYEKSKEQIDLKVNEYLKGQEALIEKLEYQENKQRTLIDLQSKEYDLLAKIRDKRREITSEYQASLDSYGWLDTETRETLFNDDDYKTLTDKLDDVQKKVVNLHSNYRKQINDLKQDEWYKQAEITNEYQRQYDILMETYELAEKEVELSKKRIEYQNIANNKNMRILQGNTWVQTPDIAKMYEAAKELKNAEQESLDTQMTMNEAQAVRNMEAYADMLNTQISGVQASIETIQDMTEEEKKFFASNLADIKELTRYYKRLNAEGETSPNLSAKVSKEVTGTDLTVPSKVATDVNTTYALPSNFTGAYGTVIAGDKTTKTVNDNLDGVETDNIIKPYTESKTDNVPDRSTWKEIPINPKLAAIFGGGSIMQHAGNIAVEGLKMTLKNMTGNTYNNKENTVSTVYSIDKVEVNQPTDSLIELLDGMKQAVMQKIIKR